ncbi:MAG: trigger factor [Raoultibacter sp.]
MKVTQKKVESDKIVLEAVATPQEVNQAFDYAAIGFAQQMGLSPEEGKSISQVVEEKLGVKDLDAIVQSQVAEFLVPFAIDKKGIVPAFPPTPVAKTALRRGSEFTFTVDVTLKPTYNLTSYAGVAITSVPFALDPTELDAEMARIAEGYAEYVTDKPHPVAMGDVCLIAIDAKLGDKPMEGLNTDGRTYPTGVGYMPAEFDENIVGMDVGETKEFSIELPVPDDTAGEQSESLTCKVTVKEIQKRVIPAVTDAWVATNLPMFGTAARLRENIEERLTEARKKEYDMYQQSLAMAELSKRFEGKIEDPIYAAMQKTQVEQIRAQVQQQGMTMEQFMEQQGGEQQFGMMMMMQVRQTLVQGYSLDALFRHEKMVLTDADILATCEMMSPQQPEALKEEMVNTGRMFALREIAERQKAAAWLLAHADVTIEELKQE